MCLRFNSKINIINHLGDFNFGLQIILILSASYNCNLKLIILSYLPIHITFKWQIAFLFQLFYTWFFLLRECAAMVLRDDINDL